MTDDEIMDKAMAAEEVFRARTRKFRILSCDGVGVRGAEETAIRAAVEKHCHCDTRWPATARIDDNNMQAFVTDLRAALADNSAAALTEARAEIERMQAALEPFASAAEGLSSTGEDEIVLSVRGWAIARLKPSELRAARAALSRKDGGKE